MPPATPSRRQCADPADAEHRLWRRLRRGQLGERFARQVTLGPFVADFVCHTRRLIVECDDSQHPCSPFDRARDARLAAAGWRVLRLRGDDILRDAEGVCAIIRAALGAPSRAGQVTAREDEPKAAGRISRPRLSWRSDQRRSSAGPRP
jgi:very-short-patch-repair endonuclease